MLTVTFSDYPQHPGEVRTSVYPQFGQPSATIDRDRPRHILLSGSYLNHVTHEIRNELSNWFFNKCIGAMHMDRCVQIDAELPAELDQWYIAVEHYKGKCHD